MDTKDNISNNLMRLLNDNNMTRTDLAKILNVSESTVGKWILKKSVPRMGIIEDIADYFNVNKSDILEYKYPPSTTDYKSIVAESGYEYKYFPVSVSAGALENIDGQLDYTPMVLPDEMLGKYARNKNIIILKVNGESMNNIIPNGSYIVVDTSKKHASDIKDRDIVVIAENGLYTVKRYINDPTNERFIFKPDSSDDTYLPIEISYSRASEIELIGRVIKYIVNLY